MKCQSVTTVECSCGKNFACGLTLKRFVGCICCVVCCVGTSRGEADGFALDILSKLKDVKSKVSIGLRSVKASSHSHHTETVSHVMQLLVVDVDVGQLIQSAAVPCRSVHQQVWCAGRLGVCSVAAARANECQPGSSCQLWRSAAWAG